MFAMYTKSEENWSHINGVMSKKRKPKAMKRTIVVKLQPEISEIKIGELQKNR